MPEYGNYSIVQDKSTGAWIVFQELPEFGKQVVQLAESESESKQKINQLISGEIIPLFYSSKEEEKEQDWGM